MRHLSPFGKPLVSFNFIFFTKTNILETFLLGSAFFFLTANVGAQELPRIAPSNPEVAAMGKYGDIPVGYHTGVPGISIPIFQLSGRSTDVPVSLSYHASGIRVNEIASRVGLGWTLNAGGSISRSVRGIPDDYVTGFLNPDVTVASFLAASNTQKGSWITGFHDEYDFESDIYYYNFLGESGKFFFKQDGSVVTHPKTDIKIERILDGNDKIIGWEVTDTNGTLYYFGISKDGLRTARDLSTTYSLSEPQSSIPDPPQAMENYTTSWKLMDIETFDSELTSLSYDFSNIEFYNVTGQQKEIPTYGGTSSNPVRTNYSWNTDKVHRLTSIANDRGSISFEYNMARTDLKFDFALTDIKLKDKSNNLIDAYRLNFDYFTSTQHLSNSIYGDLDQRRKRLYLQNIQQIIGGEVNQQYSFEYNTANILPDRLSYAQDFWGYYNGQTNNFFYPEIEWTTGLNDTYTTIVGGDRKVYETFAKACMLEKITYPTGGSTEFTFEPNRIGNVGFFGLTETEEVVIDFLSSIGSSNVQFESEVTINDPSQYVGGITWSVNLDNDCDPSAFDCPRAELYKYNGSSYDLIAASNGVDIIDQGIVYDETQPLQLKMILYNDSGSFPPAPRQDIRSAIEGRVLTSGSENAIKAGGLRVSKIKTVDHDNTPLLERDFLYTLFNDSSTTSGAALNPPTFIYQDMPYCNDQGATAGPMDLLQSNSIFPLTNGSSYTTCYTEVTELLDSGEEGKNEYTYLFVYDGEGVQSNIYATGPLQFNINTPLQDFSHRRGMLTNKKTYAKSGVDSYKLVQETANTYNPFGENLLEQNVVIDYRGCFGGYSPYQNLSERFYRTSQTVTNHFDSEDVSVTTTYGYDIGYNGRTFPLETVTTDSRGNTTTVKTYYPNDKSQLSGLSSSSDDAIDRLIDQFRITVPLQVNTTVTDISNVLLSESIQRNNYKDWISAPVLPQLIETSKESELDLETRITYHSYYSNGNVREVSKQDGPRVVYLWGYDDEYPVAKIENCTYAQVEGILGSNPDFGSGTLTTSQENNLRSGLPSSMVTTYEYEPLVGVTAITDPSGYRTTYEYDEFNRLSAVKDEQGRLVEDYRYHYKDQ